MLFPFLNTYINLVQKIKHSIFWCFFSVDKRTDSTRDLGTDAVRVIFKWDTKNGVLYKKHKKLYRVDNLFVNLSEALAEAVKEIFNLNGKAFTPDIGATLT